MGTRTITLSDRPPVQIDTDDWPEIASAHDTDDRAHPFQANREWTLKVREHADGRALVYGVSTSSIRSEDDRRGGVLLASDDRNATSAEIVTAIHTVACDLWDPDTADRLARECVADLPAEAI